MYLSILKDRIAIEPQYYKHPSLHLSQIFVNLDELEQSNQPRYVKNKRRKRIVHNDDDSISSTEFSRSSSSTDSEKNKKILQRKQKKEPHLKINENKQNQKQLNIKLHHIVIENFKNLQISDFAAHIPRNGGYFISDGKRIPFINTCTIDNYLFAFWVLSRLISDFQEKIPQLVHTRAIKEIIKEIENFEWDKARQIWYETVMQESLKTKKVNFYGEVEVFFLKYMYIYQTHNLIQICTQNCNNNGNLIIAENSGIINFGRLKNTGIGIVTDLTFKCSSCRSRVTCEVHFINNPNFIFMETTSHFKINEVPKQFRIQHKTYNFLCAILHFRQRRHFVSIFEIENKNYLIDDLSPNSAIELKNNNSKHLIYFSSNISSALYYLVD